MTNYTEEVKSCVLDWIRDNYENKEIGGKLRDREEWEQELNDDLFNEDSVTGNASGSFFCNTWKARDMWLECDETEAQNMIDDFGVDMNEHWCDYEYLDVSMRCYVLGSAISEALDELEGECEDEEESEICYFLKSDLLGMIAELRDQFEEDGDGECSHTIDFLDDGSMEIDAYPTNSWMACCEFNKEDMAKTDEELLQKAIKEATTYNENICFD